MSTYPNPRAVHIVHDAYLTDVVEATGICPFARSSREQGRVWRALIWADDPTVLLNSMLSTVRSQVGCAPTPPWEILLLTFVGSTPLPRPTWNEFEDLHRDFRELLRAEGLDRHFYSVPFHPDLGVDQEQPDTPAKLIRFLRQSPDPVVQCVNSSVLDRVKQQAQVQARAKLQRELAAMDPRAAAIARNLVLTDSQLSEDIARRNFAAWGGPSDLREFQAKIAAIREFRLRAYFSETTEVHAELARRELHDGAIRLVCE